MDPRPKPTVGIGDLPDEVLLEIFSHLPLDDLARSARVCEKWHVLSRSEGLWQQKEWNSGSVVATRKLLEFGGGIPRFHSLRLLHGSEYAIRVTWPEVTVHLYVDRPFRWVPYFRSFDTESLEVSDLVVENVSSFIECTDKRTLRRICVTGKDSGHIWQFDSMYYASPTWTNRFPKIRLCKEQTHRQNETSHHGESERANVSDTSEPEGAGTDCDAVCPALEVLEVQCKWLTEPRLLELCALGPLRVLRVESGGLRGLRMLRRLASGLEELSVADCSAVPAGDFAELRGLLRLRVLRLGKSCLFFAQEARDVVAHLPHLQTFSLNGREVLESNRPATDAAWAHLPPGGAVHRGLLFAAPGGLYRASRALAPTGAPPGRVLAVRVEAERPDGTPTPP